MQAKNFTPPYVSFKTVDNVLEKLGGDAMPPRLDKGYLSNLAGGTISAVLSTLRGFDLISEDGTITEDLRKMATDTDYRRTKWRNILDEFYSAQLSLAGKNATALQLEESFHGMGISGSTTRKSIVFYLAVVEYTDAPNSPNFRPPKQSVRKAGPSGGTGGKVKQEDDRGDGTPSATEPLGEKRVIDLGEAGTVTVYVDVKWLDLTKDTFANLRDLVNQLSDLGADDLDDEREDDS